VPVPKRAVHEHADARLPEHEIRLPRKRTVKPPSPDARGIQGATECELWCSVPSAHTRHETASLLGRQLVRHAPVSKLPRPAGRVRYAGC
jgi:hypothetical protein